MFHWWVTTPLALEQHPSAAAARAAGLTVTAGFDPDPSVVPRAQTPATHHSRARSDLRSPLSSLNGREDLPVWLRSSECGELWRSHLLAPPAGGKGAERRAGAVRGAGAETGDRRRRSRLLRNDQLFHIHVSLLRTAVLMRS